MSTPDITPDTLAQPEPMLTPDEVAAWLRVKSSTVLEWARTGRIISTRVGGRGRGGEYRFLRSDVEAYLAANRVVPATKVA